MVMRRAACPTGLGRGAGPARSGRIAAADLAEHEAMLLAAARRLFYERGFEGTSIDTVARAARVSPKTIYGRFGGKDGLFAAVMHERSETILAPLRAPIAGHADVRASLITFAERLLDVTTQDEALLIQRVVIAESARFPEVAKTFYEAGPKRGIATIAEFFRRAVTAGVFTIEAPHVAAEMFTGALLGAPIRQAILTGRDRSPAANAKRARDVVDLFMRAYARPQPDSGER